MNAIRKWIRNVFGFSGREVNGFIILLPLMVILIMAQPLYRLWLTNRTPDFTQERRVLDSIVAQWEQPDTLEHQNSASRALFYFDPNHASIQDLTALGFSEILSKRIANYRQKGGQFRVKSDLMKIYGLDSSLYLQLYTYITLPAKYERSFKTNDSLEIKRGREVIISFDINTADTSQLKSVFGIGPALASRIIRFRDGLGGFIKKDQLNEVYGLDSTVVNELFQRAFIKNDFVPQKINMNVADEKEFAAHPYIRRGMAKAIVAYRFQHGHFTDVGDLRKLGLYKETEIEKLLPYLKVND
jgi:DNA uptake protein ComE-like DNA-binding protein